MMKSMIAATLAAGLAAPALAAADAPADAVVTLPQFQAEARARLMQADADHDGKLSPAEMTAARDAMRGGAGGPPPPGGASGPGGPGGPGGRDPGRMFQMMDANGDGFLDAAEIDTMSARRFERMDANGDGKVTPEERAASRGMGRGRMGGGGGAGWGGGDQSGGGGDRPDN